MRPGSSVGVTAAALGALVLLASACGGEAPVAAAAATTLTVTDAAADATAGRQFSACGARFALPDAWEPLVSGPGHWTLTGEAGSAAGFVASARCVDEAVLPSTRYPDLQSVRDELGEGPEQDAAFRMYEHWLDASPRHPDGLIGLRQEQHEGPGRVLLTVWSDRARRAGDAPAADDQGMIALHWSEDDPAQVQQYQTFRALFDSSFTTTPPGIGHNRANTR